MEKIILLIGIVSYVSMFWIFFTKANRPGWLALIPVYGLIAMGQIVKKPISGTIAGFASISLLYAFIASLLVRFNIASDSLISGDIASVGGLGILVWYIAFLFMLVGMTKAFDKKGWFWVLFVFFPYIAVFLTNSARFISDNVANQVSTPPSSNPTVS